MPEKITFEATKRPFELLKVSVSFSSQMGESEKISTCVLVATNENDGTVVTGTFLVSASGTIPGGIATGGSTKTIVNTAQEASNDGFIVGDTVVNITKGFKTKLKKISTATNPNDTLEFAEQEIASAVSDDYTAQKAIASVQAGAAGDRVRVNFQVTTNLGNQFQADVIVHVVS